MCVRNLRARGSVRIWSEMGVYILYHTKLYVGSENIDYLTAAKGFTLQYSVIQHARCTLEVEQLSMVNKHIQRAPVDNDIVTWE
jgi:hypothetical protein